MVPTNIPDKDGIIEATDDPETNEILSETHYYPFGMAWKALGCKMRVEKIRIFIMVSS